nr:DDE-type integrase/transposase/recombinase [Methanocaldococcus villosus]
MHLEKYIENKHNIYSTQSYIYYTEEVRPYPEGKEEKKELDENLRFSLLACYASEKPKRFSTSKPNEMWQIDFKIVDVDGVRYNLLLIIDDHSRFILHAGIYKEATTDVVISALEEYFEKHGTSKKILTDNGTQFIPAKSGISRFQKFLMERKILHIKTSIRHPQTIGKVERISP